MGLNQMNGSMESVREVLDSELDAARARLVEIESGRKKLEEVLADYEGVDDERDVKEAEAQQVHDEVVDGAGVVESFERQINEMKTQVSRFDQFLNGEGGLFEEMIRDRLASLFGVLTDEEVREFGRPVVEEQKPEFLDKLEQLRADLQGEKERLVDLQQELESHERERNRILKRVERKEKIESKIADLDVEKEDLQKKIPELEAQITDLDRRSEEEQEPGELLVNEVSAIAQIDAEILKIREVLADLLAILGEDGQATIVSENGTSVAIEELANVRIRSLEDRKKSLNLE